jgi:hypothetical protein
MPAAWQDGAGSLLLLAAAHQTGLLARLTQALPLRSATAPARLARMLPATIQALLLTLLFLSAVGLRRTWDLRSYAGSALALLTGRPWAYGYRHVERYLAAIARAGGAETLTNPLAAWTTQLWCPTALASDESTITVYSDGHRKPVYTDDRIGWGLIGRTGAIEGCRALVLLHDDNGHPLLVMTARGDTHLTVGLPQILARYEQVLGRRLVAQIIVDREGMGADFLAGLVADRRMVITLLRSRPFQSGGLRPVARHRRQFRSVSGHQHDANFCCAWQKTKHAGLLVRSAPTLKWSPQSVACSHYHGPSVADHAGITLSVQAKGQSSSLVFV